MKDICCNPAKMADKSPCMFLGIDSSTQSLSCTVIDPASGEIVADMSVNFGSDLPEYEAPSGFIPGGEDSEVHSDPLMWLDALDLCLTRLKESGCDLSQITALCGSGQQHGSVYLRECFGEKLAELDATKDLKSQLAGCLTRKTSPIWMDSSTSAECEEIAAAVGGNAEVCKRTGSIMIERFTGSQIRRFAKTDPSAYRETGVIHLVSSYLASVLAGQNAPIDEGDGAGMNLMNLADGDWDHFMVEATAPDLAEKLPPVAASSTLVGTISPYFVEKYGFNAVCHVVAFSGDNPCSLVGMGASTPGKVVISLGTSDTFFAAMPRPVTDPNGFGHVFGNPMGGNMSLICFMNGSLAREALKDELGVGWDAFDLEALSAVPAGNGGKVTAPFYNSEITPRLESDGVKSANFTGDETAAEKIRALVEGQFLNMKLHSQWLGVDPTEISLTGGASQNDGIAQIVADVFGVPVARLAVAGSAGLGAAMRAAVALGEDLAELEQKFCAPEPGSTRRPQGVDYSSKERALKELIDSY